MREEGSDTNYSSNPMSSIVSFKSGGRIEFLLFFIFVAELDSVCLLRGL